MGFETSVRLFEASSYSEAAASPHQKGRKTINNCWYTLHLLTRKKRVMAGPPDIGSSPLRSAPHVPTSPVT